MSFGDDITDEQREEARSRRDRIENPLEADPGMSDDGGWGAPGDELFGSSPSDDPFKSSSSGGGWGSDSGSSWGSDSGGGWGSSTFGGGFGASAPPAPPPEKSTEDKVFDGVKLVLTGFITFLGEFVKSFKEFDALSRVQFGRMSILLSLGVTALGLVLFFFGKDIGLSLIVGALLSMGVGVLTFMFAYDAVSGDTTKDSMQSDNPFGDEDDDDMDIYGSADSSENYGYESDTDTGYESSDISWGGGTFDDEEIPELEDVEVSEEPVSPSPSSSLSWDSFDTDLAMDAEPVSPLASADALIEAVPNSMLSREYLYGVMQEVLPSYAPDFADVKVIDKDSDLFEQYDVHVQEAALRHAPSSTEAEDLVYIKKMSDGVMFTLLETTRPKWVKNTDKIALELQGILQFDKKTMKRNPNIICTSEPVGDSIYFKVIKDKVATVSVGDVFRMYPDVIKDVDNKMPIVLGLDENGLPVIRDFSTINSLLMSGMPRSGKSWTSVAIIAQMMMFKSPSEVNFYFCDPKGKSSDFYPILTPHVKSFTSNIDDIFDTLRYIVNVEGERRAEYIGNQGYQNVVDYRLEHPEDDSIPDIYLVVDEVISAVADMSQEKRKEFSDLLKKLVSRLPGFGVRLFMVPHVIKHEVVSKTVTDLIPCRVSVRGDANHIETTTGFKKFSRSLLYQGSMAARFDSDAPIFIQSVILSETAKGPNGIEKILDFLRRFWSKAYPEGVEDSEYTKRGRALKQQEVSQTVVTTGWEVEEPVLVPDVNVSLPVVEESSPVGLSGGTSVLPLTQVNEMLEGVHEPEFQGEETLDEWSSGVPDQTSDFAFPDEELMDESDITNLWGSDETGHQNEENNTKPDKVDTDNETFKGWG